MIKYFIILLSFFVFICPTSVRAVFTLSGTPNNFYEDEDVFLHTALSLSGQSNKNYFIEAAFQKDEEGNYFGLTNNNGQWIPYVTNSSPTLLQVTTNDQGIWNGTLKAKIDKDSNYYQGSGDYRVKLKRFTTGGSSSWSDNTITITIKDATPSATPSPSPLPSLTSLTIPTTPEFSVTLPNQADSTQEILITIVITKLSPNTTYYLKGAFYKEGSTNYFGLTKVHDSWVPNNKSYIEQMKITTDNTGSWSSEGNVMVDTSDSGFTGSGDYLFKLARYTTNGSGPTWTSIKKITITHFPPFTPPALSPTPSPTSPTILTTPSVPIASSSSVSEDEEAELEEDPLEASVAGESFSIFMDDTKPENLPELSQPDYTIFKILFILGITTFLTGITITVVKILKKRYDS